jgi:hypothetical protein
VGDVPSGAEANANRCSAEPGIVDPPEGVSSTRPRSTHRRRLLNRRRALRACQNSAASDHDLDLRLRSTPGARGRRPHPALARRSVLCRAGRESRRRGRRHARRTCAACRSCRFSPLCNRCGSLDRTRVPIAGVGTCCASQPSPGASPPNSAAACLAVRTGERSDRTVRPASSGQNDHRQSKGDRKRSGRSLGVPSMDHALFGRAARSLGPTTPESRRRPITAVRCMRCKGAQDIEQGVPSRDAY